MPTKRDQWEKIELLGEGGQGKVYKVRSPSRVEEREAARNQILSAFNGMMGLKSPYRKSESSDKLAEAVWCITRPEATRELAALKTFQIRGDDEQSTNRLEAEIKALTEIKHPAILPLIDWNLEERFIVTPYFPGGSLSKHPDLYKGNALAALKAFMTLVEGVEEIHRTGAIHRDIKHENVFVSDKGDLVLGDFGIVFFGDGDRLTRTYERAGTRYWMAPWVDRKERIELPKVDATLDIYPLGKLLWFLIAGKDVFPREEFEDPEFNLEKLFPGDPHMKDVNSLLAQCVVPRRDKCMADVQLLRIAVVMLLAKINRSSGYRQDNEESWPCRMCGKGKYKPALSVQPQPGIPLIVQTHHQGYGVTNAQLKMYSCDNCNHVELFIKK